MSEGGGTQPTTPLASGVATAQHTTQANAAAAAVSASIVAPAGKVAYLSGFEVTGAGATAGSTILVTVTTPTVRANYELVIPAGVGVSITPLVVELSTPIPSDAVAGTVTVNVPSFGAGNVAAAVNAHGYTA